jgi:nucleoid-associated protein YgaU
MKRNAVVISHIPLNSKGGEMKKNIKLTMALIAMIIVGMVLFGMRMNQVSKVTCDVSSVIAQSGDTLWDIGYKHCGGNRANMEEVRYQMIKLNGDVIQPGQVIILP